MNTDQLWNELVAHEIARSHFFGRPLVLISHESFAAYRKYFIHQDLVLLNDLQNYRSAHWWRHIHAVVREDGVQFHLDRCNPNVSFWFNIPHAFFDVIPYFVWCLLTLKKPYRF